MLYFGRWTQHPNNCSSAPFCRQHLQLMLTQSYHTFPQEVTSLVNLKSASSVDLSTDIDESKLGMLTWKQSWSWPRMSRRSCCVAFGELFLSTSFCWLKAKPWGTRSGTSLWRAGPTDLDQAKQVLFYGSHLRWGAVAPPIIQAQHRERLWPNYFPTPSASLYPYTDPSKRCLQTLTLLPLGDVINSCQFYTLKVSSPRHSTIQH